MKLLMNPVVLRMGLLLLCAMAAFGLGLFVMRRLRKNLTQESEFLHHSPMAAEGLPVHAYHAVIQQLKQQKHELTTQQLSERRKAKASDTLSSTVLANLSCGVLFFNAAGLVRQANSAARSLLGYASPIGLHVTDIFRTASLRVAAGSATRSSVEQILAPALSGKSSIRGLLLNYVTRDGESRVLEVTASPVLADDASLLGTTLLVTDKTDIERFRHDQRMQQEVSAELALGLKGSLASIAEYARQLATNGDPERARRLADSISYETAQLESTIGSFLGGARGASAGS